LNTIPKNGPWKVGTSHRARVVGYSPVDGLVQLSLQPSVLEMRFLRVADAQVGEVIKVRYSFNLARFAFNFTDHHLLLAGYRQAPFRLGNVPRHRCQRRRCRLAYALRRHSTQEPREEVQAWSSRQGSRKFSHLL